MLLEIVSNNKIRSSVKYDFLMLQYQNNILWSYEPLVTKRSACADKSAGHLINKAHKSGLLYLFWRVLITPLGCERGLKFSFWALFCWLLPSSGMKDVSCSVDKWIIEHPKLDMTHKDHRVQLQMRLVYARLGSHGHLHVLVLFHTRVGRLKLLESTRLQHLSTMIMSLQ